MGRSISVLSMVGMGMSRHKWLSSVVHRGRDFLVGAMAGLAALAMASGADIRTMVVTNDLVLDQSAMLHLRLVVHASNVTIEGNGATLEGSGTASDPKSLEQAGVGVLLEGCLNVTVRNL